MGTPSSPDKRIRGRKGQELRKRRLRNEPLCRMCKAEGKVTAATEVDHIDPLALGGEDTDENCQSLCAEHHLLKTASEDSGSLAAATHPAWLKPSGIPITIISGPPCSGKTTYLNEHSQPGDILIDLDTLQQGIRAGYSHWQGDTDTTLLNRAMRQRNAILGGLHRLKRGRAWLIVQAPSQAERDWWANKLGGQSVLLHPGTDECKRRAEARGTPRAIEGVDQWERLSREPWSPDGGHKRRARLEISSDGWPVQE